MTITNCQLIIFNDQFCHAYYPDYQNAKIFSLNISEIVG
jgi:superoxide dismutase